MFNTRREGGKEGGSIETKGGKERSQGERKERRKDGEIPTDHCHISKPGLLTS